MSSGVPNFGSWKEDEGGIDIELLLNDADYLERQSEALSNCNQNVWHRGMTSGPTPTGMTSAASGVDEPHQEESEPGAEPGADPNAGLPPQQAAPAPQVGGAEVRFHQQQATGPPVLSVAQAQLQLDQALAREPFPTYWNRRERGVTCATAASPTCTAVKFGNLDKCQRCGRPNQLPSSQQNATVPQQSPPPEQQGPGGSNAAARLPANISLDRSAALDLPLDGLWARDQGLRQTLLEDGDSGESSPPRGSSGGAEKGKLLFPSRARNACVLFPSPSS